MKKLTFFLAVPVVLAMALVGCGGAGGDTNAPTSNDYKQTYTEPPAPTGTNVYAPVIKKNTALSTPQLAVFDVTGNATTVSVRGLVLNLQVDTSKVSFDPVPGGASQVGSAGFGEAGGGAAKTAYKMLTDGTGLLVVALQRPASPIPANGSLLRFALRLNPNAIEGVVRVQVANGSGLVDENGNLISGTSPVMGRLEVTKS